MSFLDLMRYAKRGMPTITGFMSDQKPSHGDAGRVVHFLNHPTAMITGTETVARRLNAAVVYWDMQKPSRGHYHIDIRLITDQPKQLPEGAITDRYASLLAQTIRRRPDIWLWTHNRWKKSRQTAPIRIIGIIRTYKNLSELINSYNSYKFG